MQQVSMLVSRSIRARLCSEMCAVGLPPDPGTRGVLGEGC